MVAPLEPPSRRALSPAMRRAHRLVAATLLGPEPQPPRVVSPLRAWLLAGWMAAAAIAALVVLWRSW